MKLKKKDIWIDGISYDDEVGDRVLYPDNLDGTLYTITKIDESEEFNVTYTLAPVDGGEEITVPFDDTIHVESQIALCRYQVETYETLQTMIVDSRKFLEKFPS